jgi:hypothetical protein
LEVFFAAAVGSLGETVLELALLLGVSHGSRKVADGLIAR